MLRLAHSHHTPIVLNYTALPGNMRQPAVRYVCMCMKTLCEESRFRIHHPPKSRLLAKATLNCSEKYVNKLEQLHTKCSHTLN